MKKFIICFFLLSFLCFAEREIYVVKKTKGKIKIDGVIGKKEWEGATIIKNFYRSGALNKKVHSKTTVYLLYDNKYLYIAGMMEDKDIIATVKEHDGNVWNDDVFEIFIKPEFHSPHYYEIDINPLGTIFDAFFPRKRAGFPRFVKYSSAAEVATKIKGTLNNWKDIDTGWGIEVKIPFSAFSQTTDVPQPNTVWYFAICRYDYSVYLKRGRELTSSAKLRRADFHIYYDYDKLVFK